MNDDSFVNKKKVQNWRQEVLCTTLVLDYGRNSQDHTTTENGTHFARSPYRLRANE